MLDLKLRDEFLGAHMPAQQFHCALPTIMVLLKNLQTISYP
jgi:hypothetical protein